MPDSSYPQHLQELERAFLEAKTLFEKQQDQLKQKIEIEFIKQFGPADGTHPYLNLVVNIIAGTPVVTATMIGHYYVNQVYKNFEFHSMEIVQNFCSESILKLSFTYQEA